MTPGATGSGVDEEVTDIARPAGDGNASNDDLALAFRLLFGVVVLRLAV